jgi:hypothetical protein
MQISLFVVADALFSIHAFAWLQNALKMCNRHGSARLCLDSATAHQMGLRITQGITAPASIRAAPCIVYCVLT